MKLFKYFGIVFLILISLISVSATLDDAVLGYSYDEVDTTGTTMDDVSGTGNDGVCNGMIGGNCNTIAGKILNASGFSNAADYVNAGNLDTIIKHDSDWTINYWFKGPSTNNYDGVLGWDSGSKEVKSMKFPSSHGSTPDAIYVSIGDGSAYYSITSSNNVFDNTWRMVTITYTENGVSDTLELFVDDVSQGTAVGNIGNWGSSSNFHLGTTNGMSDYYNGDLDMTLVYDRVLTSGEITELYNGSDGFNPYIAPPPPAKALIIDNISLSNNTITNDTSLNILLDLINISTNGNVNTDLYLSNGSNYQIGTNTLNVNYTLNISEGIYDLWTYSYNIETNVTSSNYTYTFDHTAPNISIIGNITQDFIVNFSTIFNVTDALSGLQSCTLNITYLENITNASQYDKFINCTDTTTFEANGLYNGFIIATDNADNVATLSINGTIQSVVEINFFQPNGSQIYDYDYELISPNGFESTVINTSNPVEISPVVNGSLDLGNWTIIFSKFGFITTNFTIPINVTSGGEVQNYTVGISLLYLNIFDTDTDSLINQNVSIELIGPSFAGTFVTSNGTITIDNITAIPDFYQLLVNSNDYAELSYIFQHTGYEAVNLSLYMQFLNDTTSILYIVKDKLGNPMGSSEEFPKCLVQVAEYDITTNSYILQTMEYTNSNGEIIFDLDITKSIKNTVICDSGTFIFDGEKITSTPVFLTIGAEAIDYFEDQLNIRYSPINYTQVNNLTGRFSLAYSDSNAVLTQACLNVSEKVFNGENFIFQQCLSTATGSLNIDFNTSEGKTYIARGYFIYNSVPYNVPSYVKVIPIAYEDLGLLGLFFTGLLVFAIGLAGLSMPQGAKFLGVMFGGTIGLWIGSVINFIPMNYYVLTTWSVLLILGAIFS